MPNRYFSGLFLSQYTGYHIANYMCNIMRYGNTIFPTDHSCTKILNDQYNESCNIDCAHVCVCVCVGEGDMAQTYILPSIYHV